MTKNALLGLAVRFGLQMTENIATFLKMGPEFSSVTYTVIDGPGESFSNKQRLTGFSVGTGIDFTLTPHLHLRVDWTFTANPTARFPDFHFSGGGTSSRQKVTLQTQAFRVGLSYAF